MNLRSTSTAPRIIVNHILWERVLQHTVKQARELCVQALVTRNEFVGEREAWHEAALLQPIDSAEGTTEENALHSGERDDAFSETVLSVHPLHCPFRLFCNWRHRVDRVEHAVFLCWILDVLFDEK